MAHLFWKEGSLMESEDFVATQMRTEGRKSTEMKKIKVVMS